MMRKVLVRRLGVLLLALLIFLALYLTSLRSYLLFHTLVELFTVVVSAGVFAIAWNARGYLHNHYLLFVGIASLFVAVIDLFHTLAYEGMGVFPGSTANLATQFWIAGRALEAGALVVAPLFFQHRLRVGTQLVVFTLLTAGLIAAVSAGVFPTAFVAGTGLTTFKITAEYVIIAGFAAATWLLWRNRAAFAAPVWRLVVSALVLTVAAELAFTQYVSVYGYANLVGHCFRLIASYLLYKAIIETGLVAPFGLLLRELKQSQAHLQEYAAALELANTELRRSEQQLRERAADLAERNQDLAAYARTVAHDLKSPVAAIVTATRTISGYEIPREQERALLSRVARTASDLSGIIDNLLLLAMVRKAEAPREPIDMAALVATVLFRFEEMIRSHHAEVTVSGPWPPAVGHAPWIEEVWANYLTNALKYGGPRPRIELGAGPICDGMARFWVRDHGPGVPAAARASLFVPFQQLGAGQGHGLGLSIVLQILAKLGGEVGVESPPGQGSLFYFTLPTSLRADAAATVPPSTSP